MLTAPSRIDELTSLHCQKLEDLLAQFWRITLELDMIVHMDENIFIANTMEDLRSLIFREISLNRPDFHIAQIHVPYVKSKELA
jgi:hypothetical protein